MLGIEINGNSPAHPMSLTSLNFAKLQGKHRYFIKKLTAPKPVHHKSDALIKLWFSLVGVTDYDGIILPSVKAAAKQIGVSDSIEAMRALGSFSAKADKRLMRVKEVDVIKDRFEKGLIISEIAESRHMSIAAANNFIRLWRNMAKEALQPIEG